MSGTVTAFSQRKRIRFLWASSPVLVGVLTFSGSIWAADSVQREIMWLLAIAAVFACILGRSWASLYIGGRKNQDLVDAGPYAFTRNPLYFSSSIGFLGIGLAFGSLTLALALFTYAYAVFSYVIKREEETLLHLFGSSYEEYCNRVPAFFPTIPVGEVRASAEETSFWPATLWRTAFDAFPFLLAFPLAKTIEWLQSSGLITPALLLY